MAVQSLRKLGELMVTGIGVLSRMMATGVSVAALVTTIVPTPSATAVLALGPSASPSTALPVLTHFATTGSEVVEAVAVAANNEVYVAGVTTERLSTNLAQINAGGNDVFVARLSSKGQVLWIRQFGSNDEDDVTTIAVSPRGEIYVGGFTEGGVSGPVVGGEDAFIALFDRKGSRKWIRQFGSTASDRITSITARRSGEVYVSGWTDGDLQGTSAGERDAFIARYDSKGKRQWLDQFGSSGSDAGNAVALTASGAIYVAGSTTGQFGAIGEGVPGTTDVLLARYTRQGAGVWQHQYGTPGEDVASAIAVDRSGRPHLTGTTTGSFGPANQGDTDLFVSSIGSDGTASWWRQQGTPALERSNAIGFARNGDLFVAGTSYGSLASNSLGGGGDILVSHFDAKGTPRWSKQFGTNGMDEATSVAIAPSGELFVGGYSDGDLGRPGAGTKDGFVARFDVRNNGTWVHQAGTVGADRIAAIAMARTTNLVAAGTTDGSLYGTSAGSTDVFVVRHDASNRTNRGWQFGTPEADEARAVAEASNGDVVVVGRTDGNLGGTAQGNGDAFVARYTSAGVLRWVRQLGTGATDTATAVAIAPNGDVFIAGNTAGSMSTSPIEANPNDQDDVFLAKYGSDGTLRWLRQFGTVEFDNVNSMTLVGTRDLYLGGGTLGSIATVPGEENREGFDGFVARYSVAGQLVWRRQFGSDSNDIVYGISRNPKGGVDITGTTGGTINEPAMGGNDAFVGHVSTAGVLQWLHQFGTQYHDGAHAVASMPNGDVSVVGFTDGTLAEDLSGGTDMFVARYSRSGTRRWLRQFGTPANDVATAAASQRNGQLFFGGYTAGLLNGPNAGNDDLFVARID